MISAFDGNYKEAIEHFAQSTAIIPGMITAENNIGVCSM